LTQNKPAEIGMPIQDIDTPALIIDLDSFEHNLNLMSKSVASLGVAHRPHAKTHKSPVIARKQIAVGAVGQCCQKVSEAEISSWHHQALNRVADPWKVVAHAPDGVIEAVECHQHPWLYAVQWHPELTAAKDPSQQRLFDKLVTASQEMSNSTQIAA